MSDWQTIDLSVSVDGASELRYPPRGLLYLSAGLLLLSILCLFVNSWVGYSVSVAASIAGGLTLLGDQRRRADPNYASLDWFRPTILVVRYATILIAVIHILRLAIEKSR